MTRAAAAAAKATATATYNMMQVRSDVHHRVAVIAVVTKREMRAIATEALEQWLQRHHAATERHLQPLGDGFRRAADAGDEPPGKPHG
jgi:predicted transcriptional regulator